MPTATDDKLLGGRYRLGEPIGRGGMGVVWAGRDEALGRDVAVKEVVLPLGLPAEDRERLRRRTLREARAAARISSPAAVTVYDVVEEDGRPWIVMELLTPHNLADVLRENGPLSTSRVAEIGLDVLDGLEAAASVGVLHRDVKPGNIMLRSNGQAILTDFGIATVEGDATVTTTGLLLGSPAYMSPERARGEPTTLASDLWSLGATLYTALAGHSPFERSGTLPTLNAVIHDPVPRLATGGELADVIDALLAKDPGARPALPNIRSALLSVAARRETATPGVIESWLQRPTERTLPAPRRDKRVLSSLLIVGLLIAVGLIGLGAFYNFPSLQIGGGSADPDAERRAEPTAAAPSPERTPDGAISQLGAGTTQGSEEPQSSPRSAAPSPTSAENADPSAEQAALPAGFRRHTDPTGFTVAVPDGWTRSTEGPRTYFQEPAGRRFLLVDQTTEPKDDPLADWQANEPSVAGRLSGYERISLDRVEYRDWNTADWEFTWQASSGQLHVLNRNIRVSDERAYALYWSVPEPQWADSRDMFDVIAQSFQPAGD